MALSYENLEKNVTKVRHATSSLVNEVKRQPRGKFAWRCNDSLLSMLWKDRKSILFSLSIHQPEQGEPAKRYIEKLNFCVRN